LPTFALVEIKIDSEAFMLIEEPQFDSTPRPPPFIKMEICFASILICAPGPSPPAATIALVWEIGAVRFMSTMSALTFTTEPLSAIMPIIGSSPPVPSI